MIHTDGTTTVANAPARKPGGPTPVNPGGAPKKRARQYRDQFPRPHARELKKLACDRDLAQSC